MNARTQHVLSIPAVRELFDLFEVAGYELRLVGGVVRDLAMDLDPKDIDMCTTATPKQMIEIGKEKGIQVLPTGIAHGTVTFVIDGEGYEITTLRVDSEHDGRHATVTFTTDWKADAARRDFTINAMSMDRNGQIYDYFGGGHDINVRVIRFVGDAEERIREDYLRVLRFFRFAARFDALDYSFSRTMFDKDWIHEGMKGVSVERIWSEMKQILSPHPNITETIEALYKSGLPGVWGWRKEPKFSGFRYHKNAISVLAGMVDDGVAFGKKWKMSRDETMELEFMVQVAKDPAVIGESWMKAQLVAEIPRDWLKNVAMIYHPSLFKMADGWVVPTFPVTGEDLMAAGMKQGKDMGMRIRTMRAAWAASDYKANKSELMDVSWSNV